MHRHILDQILSPDSGIISCHLIEDLLDSRALVYLKLGDLPKAVNDYDKALKQDQSLIGSWYGRGIARKMMGNITGGESDIAHAIEIKPDITDTFAKYGINEVVREK